jgi:hypothetical protein
MGTWEHGTAVRQPRSGLLVLTAAALLALALALAAGTARAPARPDGLPIRPEEVAV